MRGKELIKQIMARKNKNNSVMNAALSYLTAKSRTVREIELHLDAKNYGEVEIYECVERLKELGYLDDNKYALDFIESRLRTKPISKQKLRQQLYNHKLPQEVIDTAIETITDEIEQANASRVAAKYWRQFDDLEDYDRKTRVIRRLLGRGYNFHTIKQSVEAIVGSLDEIDPESLSAEEDAE